MDTCLWMTNHQKGVEELFWKQILKYMAGRKRNTWKDIHVSLTMKKLSNWIQHCYSDVKKWYPFKRISRRQTNISEVHCVKRVRIWRFPGLNFPAFRLNREIYSVNFHIQSGYWEILCSPENLQIRTFFTQW